LVKKIKVISWNIFSQVCYIYFYISSKIYDSKHQQFLAKKELGAFDDLITHTFSPVELLNLLLADSIGTWFYRA
jgi:hypothetical protein